MDVGSGLGLLGSAVATKELIIKILGPTADYVGIGIRNWTERRVENVRSIFRIAGKKLGQRINDPGSVHPKVLRLVLDEGSFCDDDLTREYFGGVLASSRSPITRDDRGAHFLSLVGKLSSYQVRTHYVLYTNFIGLFESAPGNLSQGHVRRKMRIHLPIEIYSSAMAFNDMEDEFEIATHSMNGLMREQLIDNGWAVGLSKNYSELGGKPEFPYGVIYATSITGIELYMWAMGKANIPINNLLQVRNEIEKLPGVKIEQGAIRLVPQETKENE